MIHAGNGTNIVIGGQGNDTIFSGTGDDDLIGGHNVAGGQDGNDMIDGGAGNDVICGDNCSILPNGLNTNPLDRQLTGPTIYTAVLNADGSSTYLPAVSRRRRSIRPASWSGRSSCSTAARRTRRSTATTSSPAARATTRSSARWATT